MLVKIGNKYARGAIRFTGNVLSEGFEEGYQGYISNKVARSVLKNADLEYEHIDLIDAQLWDEVGWWYDRCFVCWCWCCI